MSDRDERGYQPVVVLHEPDSAYVERMDRNALGEFDMNADGLHIRLEQGRGYAQESCSIFLHMDVLVSMLEGVGYVVGFA